VTERRAPLGRRLADRISLAPVDAAATVKAFRAAYPEVQKLYDAVLAQPGFRPVVLVEGEQLLHFIDRCATLDEAERRLAALLTVPPLGFVGGKAWPGMTDQRNGAVLPPRAVYYFEMPPEYERSLWPKQLMPTTVLDADRERLGLPPRAGSEGTNVNQECMSAERTATVAARFGSEG
jgi:hypothetical protein